MQNILIINAHQHYPFSSGKLNQSLAERAQEQLLSQGYTVKTTVIQDGYTVEEELEKHRWADVILLQSPVNWMMVTWSFKQYVDEVYTAGMDGTLCSSDGRSSSDPHSNYGTGGSMTGKRYMLSLTFNAPEAAFNNPSEYLFQGKSVDDLFLPMHMNFRFFGMMALPTFVCYDVLKNPTIEQDFERYAAHLHNVFGNREPIKKAS